MGGRNDTDFAAPFYCNAAFLEAASRVVRSANNEKGVSCHRPVIAPAFVGGSLSSTAGDEFDDMVRNSPQVRFGESRRRGYSLVEVTPAASTLTMRAAGDATDPQTTTSTLRTFTIENGVPGFA